MATEDEKQYAPYTYNIVAHDYDRDDRACYWNFVEGETYCDVSGYDSLGMIRLDFFGDWDPEHKMCSALTREEAAKTDWALVIDTERPGYAWCGDREYTWTSEPRPSEYGTRPDYHMCFKLVE